jgi:Ca2+-binding RTX toxin-like protein
MNDMRALSAALLLLVTSFFAMTAPSMAQSKFRTCGGVDLTAPADGAVLDPGYRVNFTWDSEPRGTASRDWVAIRVDAVDANSFSFDNAKKAKAERRLYKGFARGRPGVYAWAVVFYDAKGNPICQSEARTFVVIGSGFASLSSANSASGAAAAAAKAALGNWVVRLTGFAAGDAGYNGPANQNVWGTIYIDALNPVDWQGQGYTGLEVHGTKLPDLIVGSGKDDVLNGYGGVDTISGGDGNDTINGGSSGDFLNGDGGNDTINGGTGNDLMTGGSGNDTLNGEGGFDTGLGGTGNDTCSASTEIQVSC